MQHIKKAVYVTFLFMFLFLASARASWVEIWLEEGECSDATFYSGDTVYFYFQAERDCNATVILETPWVEKTLVERTELRACRIYRTYYDIGVGVTRSDWWELRIEAEDATGHIVVATCTFYVPVKKPTTTPPSTTPPETTTPPPTTAPPTTSAPTTSPPTTAPPTTLAPTTVSPSSPTEPPPTIQPTTLAPRAYSPPTTAPPRYTPLLLAGVLSAAVVFIMLYLLLMKRP